jgi:hypothetical protein
VEFSKVFYQAKKRFLGEKIDEYFNLCGRKIVVVNGKTLLI